MARSATLPDFKVKPSPSRRPIRRGENCFFETLERPPLPARNDLRLENPRSDSLAAARDGPSMTPIRPRGNAAFQCGAAPAHGQDDGCCSRASRQSVAAANQSLRVYLIVLLDRRAVPRKVTNMHGSGRTPK